jgi:GNAT superfamily N-acetyltransferase
LIHIRKANPDDSNQIWHIIQQVISKGDTYAFDPETPREIMMTYWFGRDKHTYVATEDDRVVGTFVMKDNQPGLGSHIANAGYMVHPEFAGRGIGRLMGEFSIVEAKRLGYQAMQFNFVVKSNTKAVQLWLKLGFRIIGEIPDAFRHKESGLTNVCIMYRAL